MTAAKLTGWALGVASATGPTGRAHIFPLRNRVRPDNLETPLCGAQRAPSDPATLTWEFAVVAHISTNKCQTCMVNAARFPLIEITLARGLEPAKNEAKRRGSKRAPSPETSKHAAVVVAEDAQTKRILVLAALKTLGPSTTDEIAHHLGWVHQCTSPRVHELAKASDIEDTGERRPTSRGRPAIVYRLTEPKDADDPKRKGGRHLAGIELGELREMHAAGRTVADIAYRFGIPTKRVREILNDPAQLIPPGTQLTLGDEDQ